jgi:signal peptidase I
MTILICVFAAILLASFLLTAPFLWLGAIFMKAPKATIWRAMIAAMILLVCGIAFVPLMIWSGRECADFGGLLSAALVELGLGFAQLFVIWFAIKSVFQTTFPRAIVIWSTTLIPSIVFFVVVFFPLKLFVAEAYVVPTNAMAPTIIGYHRETTCPRCGGTLILSAPEPNNPFPPPIDEDRPGICVSCRKASVKPGAAATVHPPDRILVNKLLTPARWDVIVFRYPEEPSQKYVMRLVGLPGEKVHIKGDSLWINDAKMDVPADISGLEYTAEMEFAPDLKATEENPLLLGADQYCVLGDFSKNSSDSRLWGPVPGANIEGVVCVRYWPMQRWYILR